MIDIVDIDTGEWLTNTDIVWFAEGKKKIKRMIKDIGYEFVKESYNYKNLTLWVKKRDL